MYWASTSPEHRFCVEHFESGEQLHPRIEVESHIFAIVSLALAVLHHLAPSSLSCAASAADAESAAARAMLTHSFLSSHSGEFCVPLAPKTGRRRRKRDALDAFDADRFAGGAPSQPSSALRGDAVGNRQL
jgi:hypothetical protein